MSRLSKAVTPPLPREPLDAAMSRLDIPGEYASGEVDRARALGLAPLPRMTYHGLLQLARHRFGDDHVLFEFPDSDHRLSVGDLAGAADRFARALLAAGFQHGDTLCVWSPPAPLWPVAMFGAARIGVRVCGVNTRYRREELRHLMQVCRPRAVIVATGFGGVDALELITDAVEGRCRVVATLVGECSDDAAAFLSAGRSVTDGRLAAATAKVSYDDDALIQFTSGSTGAPKGVRISQSASVAAGHYGAECVGLDPSDRLYSPLPFFHIGGTISTALAAVAAGFRVVAPQRFDAATALRSIAKDCTAFHGHGALWRILLDEHRKQPVSLPHLRKGWASGDVDFMRALRDELDVDDLVNMYGSSEAGTIACTLPRDPDAIRLGSLGHPTPGTRISIRDEDGNEVPDGDIGELHLTGVMGMTGYLGEKPRGEAWMATGDLVRRHNDVLEYRGRTDDRLKPGGENVSVAEVEAFIARDPGVEEVVVVGVPDERFGEVPAAVVRPALPCVSEVSVIARCRSDIAGFKVPRYVRIVEKLPTLDTGKVDRRRVRTELLEHLREERGVNL